MDDPDPGVVDDAAVLEETLAVPLTTLDETLDDETTAAEPVIPVSALEDWTALLAPLVFAEHCLLDPELAEGAADADAAALEVALELTVATEVETLGDVAIAITPELVDSAAVALLLVCAEELCDWAVLVPLLLAEHCLLDPEEDEAVEDAAAEELVAWLAELLEIEAVLLVAAKTFELVL